MGKRRDTDLFSKPIDDWTFDDIEPYLCNYDCKGCLFYIRSKGLCKLFECVDQFKEFARKIMDWGG